MEKIIYKNADYKFGKPIGYINIPEDEETPESFYLYKDSTFTEKYTSEEIKNFYLNSGIVAIITTYQGDNIFGGYCNLESCIRETSEAYLEEYLYYCTITMGTDKFIIIPKEAEESQG